MVAETIARTINSARRRDGELRSDAELVRRYAASGDGGAFAILVRRHGPMVFGVCRRMLGHVQDAEDAFQATFLVLAKRAQAVRSGEVSRFLYGVAVRVANKARIRRARQLTRQGELIGEPSAPDSPAPMDWLPLLDQAMSRLPERDRWPIVLCDLQGRSRAEAAKALGIAEGTLSSRLARAREKLRTRLTRLGAALSLPAMAAGLAHEATATIPNSLIESTIAAGVGASSVRELAEGVIRTMFLSKLIKLTTLGVFILGAHRRRRMDSLRRRRSRGRTGVAERATGDEGDGKTEIGPRAHPGNLDRRFRQGGRGTEIWRRCQAKSRR